MGTPAPRCPGGGEETRARAGAAGGAGAVRRWQVACGRAVLQELHRACEEASRGGHIPGGPALAWARGYAAALTSEQSCLNEWLAMADLESVRPASPPPLRYAPPPPAPPRQPAGQSALLLGLGGGEKAQGGAGRVGLAVKGWSDWVGL